MENEGLHIGNFGVWGGQQPLILSHADRMRHLYIIGQTGVGKSTLLHSLVAQDMEAGQGVALIDPHGDWAWDVCASVPSRRIDDVVVIDPSDHSYPIAFNPFYRVPLDLRPRVASNIVASFKGVWADSWGARLEYILMNTVRLVLDAPDQFRPTFLSIPRVLVERSYRQKLLEHVTDYRVRSFFVDEFNTWNDRQIAENLSSVQNKIGAVVGNPFIRNIIGQWKPTVCIDEIIAKRKILIVRLPKGTIGAEEGNLLGSMIVSSILQSTMARADQAERPPFHLYIDEFQNFTTNDFATILSEARKYALSLTTSNQYIAQLTPAITNAIFGNVGNIISFRVGAEDSEHLAHEFGSFQAHQFRDLTRGSIIARTMREGAVLEPVHGLTYLPATSAGHREKVLNKSRRAFARPRVAVEENLARWLREKEKPFTISKRR
jgi:GTPase SAR1 family protein